MIHHNHGVVTAKEHRRLETLQRKISETGVRAENTRARRAAVDLELARVNAGLAEAEEAQHVLVGSLRNWEARLDALHRAAEGSDASVWGIKKRQADVEQKTANTKNNTCRSEGTRALKEGNLGDAKVGVITPPREGVR